MECPHCRTEIGDLDPSTETCPKCGKKINSAYESPNVYIEHDYEVAADLPASGSPSYDSLEVYGEEEDDENNAQGVELDDEPTGDTYVKSGVEGGHGGIDDEYSRLKQKDYENLKDIKDEPEKWVEIGNCCQELLRKHYKIYGLFGSAGAGKSSFLEQLYYLMLSGNGGISGFWPEGEAWEDLIRTQKYNRKYNENITTVNPRAYRAETDVKEGRKIAFIDIPGDKFDLVTGLKKINKNSGLKIHKLNMYCDHLPFCSGFFLFVDPTTGLDQKDMDSSAVPQDKRGEVKDQLRYLWRFLRMVAEAGKMDASTSQEEKARLYEEVSHIGASSESSGKMLAPKNPLDAPVVLFLTKADVVKNLPYAELGKNVPQKMTPWIYLDTWNDYLQGILRSARHMKPFWLASYGYGYTETKEVEEPKGLKSAFHYLVMNSKPAWAMSTRTYYGIWKKRNLMKMK